MPNTSPALPEEQRTMFMICDRCGRRSTTLLCDDLTFQELCQDCRDRLKRRREMAPHLAKPKG